MFATTVGNPGGVLGEDWSILERFHRGNFLKFIKKLQ